MKLQKIPAGLWVFIGGGSGALTRAWVTLPLPVNAGIPWGVFAVNCGGAFLLGCLLRYLATRTTRTQPGAVHEVLRLGLGTGFLGGFTTYSTFALGLIELILSGSVLNAVLYAALSLVGGFTLCWAGMLLGEKIGAGTQGDALA